MNPSDFMISSTSPRDQFSAERAFTLTELAVVISTIALLSLVMLPVMAGSQNKAGRMQCAANLRQIYVANMVYATEYHGWLPICIVGGANSGGRFNNLAGIHYTRYVFDGQPNIAVPTNPAPVGSIYDCLGGLYHAGLIGNGQILFCPDQWGTALGANAYSPLLKSDSTGYVRTSYAFNPRLKDALNDNIARRYQRTSDLPPHNLFAADYFAGLALQNISAFPHFREQGWNVLFTDGSVQFSRNTQADNLILMDSGAETVSSYIIEDQIMNYLELDH